jgi:hypothetical protein
MNKTFEGKLAAIPSGPVFIANDGTRDQFEPARVHIIFIDNTKLSATYWRLIVGGKASLSSFDEGHQYGLPAPIDARSKLRAALDGHPCMAVRLDATTGDLLLDFGDGPRLQVLNFTHYEIWEILFPDGTGEISNYVLQHSG